MSPPTLIIKNLYLGDYSNATNLLHPLIKELNIKYVINCCKGGQNFFPNHFKYINLDWIDNIEQNINENNEIDNTLEFIEEALNKDETVFVHCGAGISRSATVIIGYLMKKYNWNYQEAYDFVKLKKLNIQPNKGFEVQLKRIFENF
jgi:protein-tyrosine phosphatase